MLFINNLQERIHPPHMLSCHPSVNSTGKRCLLSHPILHLRAAEEFRETVQREAFILQKIIGIP